MHRLFRSTPWAFLAVSLLACSAEEGAAPVQNESSTTVAPNDPQSSTPRPPVLDLVLRTRREKHVAGKPEWMAAFDANADGIDDVIAATNSPGALLIWSDSLEAPRTVEVGDYPLRPVPFGKHLAVASRSDSSLVLYDLAGETAIEQARHDLPDVPMVMTGGTVDASRGPEVFVVTKNGTLIRANGKGLLAPEPLADSVPRCATVLSAELGLIIGFQSSERLERYEAMAPGAPLESTGGFQLTGTARDLLGLDVDSDGDPELIVVSGDHEGWIFGLDGSELFDESRAPLTFKTTAIPLRLLAMKHAANPRWSLLAASSVACEVWDWLDGGPQRLLFSYAGQTPRDMLLHQSWGKELPDFWIANRDAHVISLLRNDAEGPVQPVKIRVGKFPNDVATGDIDGDGLDELFVINAKNQDISVIGRRDGQIQHGYKVSTGLSPRALLCEDIDDDGLRDLVWLDRTHAGTSLSVRLGDGKAGLRAPQGFEPIPMGTACRDFVVENFNGGARSLVVAADHEGRRLLWTRVTGGPEGLTHEPVQAMELPAPPRAIATMYQGETPRGIALAMQTAHDRSLVRIYTPIADERPAEANELVRWQLLGEVSLAGAVIDLAAGDLDGDGIDDLAYLAAEVDGAVRGRVQPLIVKGGKPAPIGLLQPGLRPQRILLDDFSGDGKAEIFVANLDSHNVNVWLTVQNSEQLAFRHLDDIGAGVGCIALAATRLDGDADLDLVVVDSANDGVSLIYNETY